MNGRNTIASQWHCLSIMVPQINRHWTEYDNIFITLTTTKNKTLHYWPFMTGKHWMDSPHKVLVMQKAFPRHYNDDILPLPSTRVAMDVYIWTGYIYHNKWSQRHLVGHYSTVVSIQQYTSHKYTVVSIQQYTSHKYHLSMQFYELHHYIWIGSILQFMGERCSQLSYTYILWTLWCIHVSMNWAALVHCH